MLREVKIDCYHYFVDDQHQIQGEYKSWREDGSAYEHCFYLNDELHGIYTRWHTNGNRWLYIEYTHGLMTGEHKIWNKDDLLVTHCLHRNDKLHGEYRDWDENGQLSTHCFYINYVPVSLNTLPYPITGEDRFYFTLKYDLQLLPI